MTKHMAAQINQEIAGVYDHEGSSIVYGDSVTGDAVLSVDVDGIKKDITIQELFETSTDTNLISSKIYRKTNAKVLNYNPETNSSFYCDVEHVIQHHNTEEKYDIIAEDGSMITTTSDHSVMVEVDGILTQATPEELEKLLLLDKDVYLIKNN